MGKRILTWSALTSEGNILTMLPRYYMEADYAPIAVRTYVEVPPHNDDAEFDIFVDDVSIFANRASPRYYQHGGIETAGTTVGLLRKLIHS